MDVLQKAIDETDSDSLNRILEKNCGLVHQTLTTTLAKYDNYPKRYVHSPKVLLNHLTPLLYVCYKLIDAAKDVSDEDERRTKWMQVVCTLIQKGADVCCSGKSVQLGDIFPLYLAACYDNVDLVELLIASGADVNQTTSTGTTALHACCEGSCLKSRCEIAKLLFHNGVEFSEDSLGKTPLYYASIYSSSDESCSISEFENLIAIFMQYTNLSVTDLADAYDRFHLLSTIQLIQLHDNISKKDYFDILMKMTLTRETLTCKKNVLRPRAYYVTEWQTMAELQSIEDDTHMLRLQFLLAVGRVFPDGLPDLPDLEHFLDILRDCYYSTSGKRILNHVLEDIRRTNDSNSFMVIMPSYADPLFEKLLHLGLYLINTIAVATEQETSLSNFWKLIIKLEDLLWTMFSHFCGFNLSDYNVDVNFFLSQLLDMSIICNEVLGVECRLDILHIVLEKAFGADRRDCIDEPLKRLIACGAQVNKLNGNNLMSLQIFMFSLVDNMNYLAGNALAGEFHCKKAADVLVSLFSAGAHTDALGRDGGAAVEMIKHSQTAINPNLLKYVIQKHNHFPTLQCLSAATIKTYNVPFEDHLPQCLRDFVYMHSV